MARTRSRVRGAVLRATALLPAALVLTLLPVAPASASTILGTTGVTPTGPCAADYTSVQAVPLPGIPYAAAASGVITEWRFSAGSTGFSAKLKILRSLGGSNYQVVGASAVAVLAASSVTAVKTRIPVLAGDLLGITPTSAGTCAAAGGGGSSVDYVAGDLGVGQQASFLTLANAAIPVAAVLEPDVDGDGYGDETQDGCVGQAGPVCADTTAPDTVITRGPQVSRTGKAKYTFSSTEAGSTFQCRLKRAPGHLGTWATCSSPKKYKALAPGRYKFQVRATDASGNQDKRPASKKLTVRG